MPNCFERVFTCVEINQCVGCAIEQVRVDGVEDERAVGLISTQVFTPASAKIYKM